jgi:hypothetical protein
MSLLQRDSHGELLLTKDVITPPAVYAILSHTWGADDDEVTFDDLEKKTGKNKAGYAKLRFCAGQAAHVSSWMTPACRSGEADMDACCY